MPSRPFGLPFVRTLTCSAVLSLLPALASTADAAEVLYLEENRVAALAPLQLHVTAQGTTSIDFFAGGETPKFRILLTASPLGLAIVDEAGEPFFTLGADAIQIDKPLTALDSVTFNGQAAFTGPPFSISSSQKIPNLNADRVDDYDGAALFALGEDEVVTGVPSFNGGNPPLFGPPFYVGSTQLVPNLNADMVDGAHAGNAIGNVALNNTTLNSSLNADMVDGAHAGNSPGNVALNNDTLNLTLNADKLDGRDAGNDPNNVAVNNGTLNSSLNADKLDSLDEEDFLRATANDEWNPTKGDMTLRFHGNNFSDLLFIDGTAGHNRVGVNNPAPVGQLDVQSDPGSTPQLRLSYDPNNASTFEVGATGGMTIATQSTSGGGGLTLAPVGDLMINPLGGSVLPVDPYRIILGSETAKYLALHVAELWVSSLVAADTLATIGGRVLVGPTTSLIADLPSASNATGFGWIDVKHDNLNKSDFAYLEANGKVEFIQITSNGATIDGGYRYTVDRSLDPTGADDWSQGDAVFNTGQVGSGWLDLYSLRGMGSANESGPTLVANVRTGTDYSDWSARAAVGNLHGLYGYGSDIYGVAFGDPDQSWLAVDPNNGLRIMSGLNQMAQWDASGNILIGQTTSNKANISITASTISLRKGETDYIKLNLNSFSGTGTIQVGLASAEHVTIGSGAVKLGVGAVENVVLDPNGVLVGQTEGTQGNVHITSSGVKLRSGLSDKIALDTSNGNITIGGISGSEGNVVISPTNLKLRSGATDKISLDTAGNILIGQQDPNQANVRISADGFELRNNTTKKIDLRSNGDVLIGTNVSDPNNTALVLFQNAQTYNGESGVFAQGDILLGSNSAGKANILWDKSAGRLDFRGGTSTQAYVDTDGSIVAGGGFTKLNSLGLRTISGSGLTFSSTFSSTDNWLMGGSGTALGLSSGITDSTKFFNVSAYGLANSNSKSEFIMASSSSSSSIIQSVKNSATNSSDLTLEGTSGLSVRNSVGGAGTATLNFNANGALITTSTTGYITIGQGSSGIYMSGVPSEIYLNGSTSNKLKFGAAGLGAPTFTSQSAGTKIVIWPGVSGSAVDYAFGVASNVMWYSIPQATSTFMHSWYAGTTELMRLQGSGKLALNTTSNAKMTQGITIAQGANDDEILTLQSSDIQHGVTTQTEADTFGYFKKQDLGTGGLLVVGVSPTTAGLRLAGIHTTNDSGKSTTAKGAVLIDGFEKGSGTDINPTMAANTNILAVRSGLTTRFILDADGDSHQDVGTSWTNFDIFEDDVPLLNALAEGVSRPGNEIREEFRGFLEKHRADLERLDLVKFSTDGHHFVNMSRLTMLLTGAVRQLHARTDRLERRLERLESGQGLNPF